MIKYNYIRRNKISKPLAEKKTLINVQKFPSGHNQRTYLK